MPGFLQRYLRGAHRYAWPLYVLGLTVIVSWHAWYWALISLPVLFSILYWMRRKETMFTAEFESYISTLRHRIRKAGEDIVSTLPVGIILYDEDEEIQWHNLFAGELLAQGEQTLLGQRLDELWPALASWMGQPEREGTLRYNDRALDLISYPEERLLYLFDNSDYHELRKRYHSEQTVLIGIHLDNLEEVTQGLGEQRQALLQSRVTNTISRWANEHQIFIRKTDSDKFFGVLNEEILRDLEESKFDLLDRVRDLTRHNKLPVTLSIGVGAGSTSLLELGEMVQSGLDLALGRGGDQVAVKRYPDKVTFYGGKSNAVEKRTRVRARVISHALSDMIKESDRVFIMGHRDPDMDAVGAAIGMLKAVEANRKEGFILLDPEQSYPAVDNLLHLMKQDRTLQDRMISPAHASDLITSSSLLIIVDVHKPSLVLAPRLLEQFERKVVIDHHRRGEEFIDELLLVYIEPYASSASEMVAELLEYQEVPVQLRQLEATAMLAGIVVDTNNFAMRTGSRTFDAASYLKRHGADTVLIQKLLQEEKDQFIQRSRIVEGAEIYRGNIAIAAVESGESCSKVVLAQAADTLLTLHDVIASFVVSAREDNRVSINARSHGEINVQVVMEKMNGGGHLTNAATQLEDISVPDAVQWLKEVLDDYLEGGSSQ